MSIWLRDISPELLSTINFENAKFWEDLDLSAWINDETTFAVRKILEYSNKHKVKLEGRKTPFIIKDLLIKLLESEDDTEHLLAKNIQSNRKLLKKDRRNKELELLTKVDTLTGLANRACLDYEINKLIELKKRNMADFSILFIDIDNFKWINDTLGHQLWDEILIKLAQILKENFRQNDLIWRWGWEEFMITLPFTGIMDAANKADKLREIVEKYFESYENLKGLNVTISVWVTQVESIADTSEILMAKADTALYKCKDDWRNAIRLQLYNPDEICHDRTCEECEYKPNCIKNKTT